MTGDQSMHALPAQASVESDYPGQPVKRRARHALRLAALLAISTAAGCGGDSDDPPAPPPASNSGGGSIANIGGPTNRAPVLTQLMLPTDSVEFLAGAGRAPIRVVAHYTDADSDVATLRVALSDGSTPAVTTPSSFVVAVVPAVGTPVVGDFELATSTARRLTVEAWVVDAAGNASNRMSATVTVRGNARLSALSFSAGRLEQIFQPGLKSYTATVGLLRPTATVTVTAEDPAATLTVEGHAVASGTASRKLTLDQGRNELDVVVTAADGTTATYTVDVTRRMAATFGQEIYLKSDRPEGNHPGTGFEPRPSHYGAALAIDGRRLAVGAWGEDSSGARDGGVLYLYSRDDGGAWRKETSLGTPSTWSANAYPEPHFGTNVAFADNSMFVAEVWSTEGWPVHVPILDGRVHVLERQADQWVLGQTLFPTPRLPRHSRFGVGLAVESGTLVVGDPLGEQVEVSGVYTVPDAYGAVSVFTRGPSGWAQSQYLTSPAPDVDDRFGERVALDGDLLAIGAPGEDSAPNGLTADPSDDSMTNAGAVFVLRREAGAWVPDTLLKAPNGDAGDGFGNAVALSGNTLVVSAPGEDSSAVGIGGNQADNGAAGSGAVYVFARDAGRWSLEAYIKASNTDAGDAFGLASDFNFSPIALAEDVLVVGAHGEDGAATGVNGDQSSNSVQSAGAAYVFTRDAQRRWTQVAYLKASNPSELDNFGSVALGEDFIAVGAAYESSVGSGLNGSQAHHAALMGYGAVYVFR